MEIVAINGTKRTETGKKATKTVRQEGQVPCVVYGGENVIHFSAKTMVFRDLIYTPDFKIAEISVDGSTYKCVLKDMQFHPVTDEILHLDFVELVEGQKVIVEIPLKYRGAAPGVKLGGKLIPLVRRIKVKALPSAIVDTLYVDISSMELGQSVRVRDIDSIEGLEIMNNGSIPVAAVEIPRALRSAGAAAEATAAAAAE